MDLREQGNEQRDQKGGSYRVRDNGVSGKDLEWREKE